MSFSATELVRLDLDRVAQESGSYPEEWRVGPETYRLLLREAQQARQTASPLNRLDEMLQFDQPAYLTMPGGTRVRALINQEYHMLWQWEIA